MRATALLPIASRGRQERRNRRETGIMMEQLLAALAETDDPDVMAIYLDGIARLQELDWLMRRPTEPLTLCAWCIKEMAGEQGLRETSDQSHGICPQHEAQEEAKRIARKLARLASVA